MLFKKEKMDMITFVKEISNNIINLPKESYSNYLDADKENSLSKEEFEIFISNIEYMRLMFLMGSIFDSNIQVKYKFTSEEIGKNFSSGMYHSYRSNSETEEKARERFANASEIFTGYFDYLENINNSEIKKNGFLFYVCMYFAQEVIDINSDDAMKNGTIAAMINGNKNIIRNYFITVYKKVKLIN